MLMTNKRDCHCLVLTTYCGMAMARALAADVALTSSLLLEYFDDD
jgi:hypothetical protein